MEKGFPQNNVYMIDWNVLEIKSKDFMVDINQTCNYAIYQKESKFSPQKLIIKVLDNEVVEIDKAFKDIFTSMGVTIPPAKRVFFSGRNVIYLKETKFPHALHDVYFPFHMNKTEFELRELGTPSPKSA